MPNVQLTRQQQNKVQFPITGNLLPITMKCKAQSYSSDRTLLEESSNVECLNVLNLECLCETDVLEEEIKEIRAAAGQIEWIFFFVLFQHEHTRGRRWFRTEGRDVQFLDGRIDRLSLPDVNKMICAKMLYIWRMLNQVLPFKCYLIGARRGLFLY